MNGTNATDGTSLSGIDHLKQSIRDILLTPIGSRVMRRTYGSNLFFLLDNPMNRGTISKIYSAVVEALAKWEPRVKVTKVNVTDAAPGSLELTIEGTYLPDGQPITIEGIVIK
jgi:hypothetical protein